MIRLSFTNSVQCLVNRRQGSGGDIAAKRLTGNGFRSASVDLGTERSDSHWPLDMVGRREVRSLPRARETWASNNGLEGRGYPCADRSAWLNVKRRRIDPRLAKLHRSYTVEQVARLFSCHRNTVRSWLQSGLKPTDSNRPTLILGAELRRFHGERRAKAKRPTPPGMIHCLGCRGSRRPAGNMVDYVARTPTSGDLVGICPDCNAILYRRVNLAKLVTVSVDLEVTFTEGGGRIRQRKQPSVNHDSEDPRAAHADSQR